MGEGGGAWWEVVGKGAGRSQRFLMRAISEASPSQRGECNQAAVVLHSKRTLISYSSQSQSVTGNVVDQFKHQHSEHPGSAGYK